MAVSVDSLSFQSDEDMTFCPPQKMKTYQKLSSNRKQPLASKAAKPTNTSPPKKRRKDDQSSTEQSLFLNEENERMSFDDSNERFPKIISDDLVFTDDEDAIPAKSRSSPNIEDDLSPATKKTSNRSESNKRKPKMKKVVKDLSDDDDDDDDDAIDFVGKESSTKTKTTPENVQVEKSRNNSIQNQPDLAKKAPASGRKAQPPIFVPKVHTKERTKRKRDIEPTDDQQVTVPNLSPPSKTSKKVDISKSPKQQSPQPPNPSSTSPSFVASPQRNNSSTTKRAYGRGKSTQNAPQQIEEVVSPETRQKISTPPPPLPEKEKKKPLFKSPKKTKVAPNKTSKGGDHIESVDENKKSKKPLKETNKKETKRKNVAKVNDKIDNVVDEEKGENEDEDDAISVDLEPNSSTTKLSCGVIVLSCFAGKDFEIDAISSMVDAHPEFSLSTKITDSTHLVVAMNRRTFKVLLAIARGIWVLKFDWILASIGSAEWIDEEKFETVDWFSGCKKSRVNRLKGKKGLLDGIKICVSTKNTSLSIVELRLLVEAAGGRLVITPKECDYCITSSYVELKPSKV
jgi:hypothetical protein